MFPLPVGSGMSPAWRRAFGGGGVVLSYFPSGVRDQDGSLTPLHVTNGCRYHLTVPRWPLVVASKYQLVTGACDSNFSIAPSHIMRLKARVGVLVG